MLLEDFPDTHGVDKLFQLYLRFPKLPNPADYAVVEKSITGFLANAIRLRGLLMFPSSLIQIAFVGQKAACKAAFKISDKRTCDEDDLTDVEQTYAREYFVKELDTKSLVNIRKLAARKNAGLLRSVLGYFSFHDELRTAYEAALGSIVVGAWTTFEALATDLWVEVVNARPMTFGDTALRARPWDKKGRRIPLHPKKAEPQKEKRVEPINYDILKANRFNLSDTLGTVIHQSMKFDFNSLDGIEYAYRQVFGERVKTTFSRYSRSMDRLEAMRHVLVHRGGKADKSFKDRVSRYADLNHLKSGDPVPIDGERVLEFVPASIKLCSALLSRITALCK